MRTTYGALELKIVIIREGAPDHKAAWKIEGCWSATTQSLAHGVADSYKLACAAAGEAFDRLTEPQEEAPQARDLLGRVNAAFTAVIEAETNSDGKHREPDRRAGITEARHIMRKIIWPEPERKATPGIVRALQEALRVYRNCGVRDDTDAMAAAIAAYEAEKAKG